MSVYEERTKNMQRQKNDTGNKRDKNNDMYNVFVKCHERLTVLYRGTEHHIRKQMASNSWSHEQGVSLNPEWTESEPRVNVDSQSGIEPRVKCCLETFKAC